MNNVISKSKKDVSKRGAASGEILVPVEKIIKVEDLERELKEKKQLIADLSKKNVDLTKENTELKKRLGLK